MKVLVLFIFVLAPLWVCEAKLNIQGLQVESTIAEVLAPLQEDISGVMHLTNERSPFFSLQVQFNEEVGRILSNFTVNIKISYLQTKANHM